MLSNQLRTRMLLILIVLVVGGMVGALLLPRPPTPADGSLVFSASATVHGASLGEWNARQWQWTLSRPIGSNPGQDATGVTCGAGQTGPVFFLPRNFPPCRVPTGTLIFVPIVGTECSTVEPPPYFGANEGELRSCAAAEIDRYANITVRIDGEVVPGIDAYRTSSPLFSLRLPEHNVLGVPPGAADAVADGYQIMVAPLPIGAHEIMVHVELTDGTVLPDKVLQLTVVASGAAERK